ncbi:retinol dehydrogenase 16-like [Tachypleus tridentatus]|uniref:retinol dehydrogenase 16-like n=1 Tax=Tachypleus tridentatus TaxID=6853 RepID=UPI003FD1B301
MMIKLFIFALVVTGLWLVGITSSVWSQLVKNIGSLVVTVFLAYVLSDGLYSAWQKYTGKVSPKQKAVFISGCDTGFGHELAKRLHSLGFHVFAGCLKPTDNGAQQLRSVCSDRLEVIELDVTDENMVSEAVKRVRTHLDDHNIQFWALVNNAGVATFAELEFCPESEVQRMFEVNVFGTMRLTRAFLPLLRARRGRIICVASYAGRITVPGLVGYSMTKHAVISYADGLRNEMRDWGIQTVLIEPSLYQTSMTARQRLVVAAERLWEKTSLEVKEAYGEDYIHNFKTKLTKLLKERADPDVTDVIDGMEEAVTSITPKISYRISKPSKKLFFWILLTFMPTCLKDWFLYYPTKRSIPSKIPSRDNDHKNN